MKAATLKFKFILILVFTFSRLHANSKTLMLITEHQQLSSDTIQNVTLGKFKERYIMDWEGTNYRVDLFKGNLMELHVNERKIPKSEWGAYDIIVKKIKIQIMEDQEQARKDQEQARKDQEQARKDQELARKDQEQARKDQELARKDQEQARKDQEQARKDQEQARKDQELLKLMIVEIIKDQIVSERAQLHSISLRSNEMEVNGKPQPNHIFIKYSKKYSRFSNSRIDFGEQLNEYHIYHAN